jgi:hypothetical protein
VVRRFARMDARCVHVPVSVVRVLSVGISSDSTPHTAFALLRT